MTMLAALDQGDHIIVAADSRTYGMRTKFEDNNAIKLWQLGERPIVWGFFDSAKVGADVQNWLEEHGQELSHESWEEFSQTVAYQVTRFNESDPRSAKFIFAGYIDGRARILIVNPNGDKRFYLDKPTVLANEHGPTAIHAALNALRAERGDRFTLDDDTFLAAFEAAGGAMDAVGGQTQMWKVTPAGAEKLQIGREHV